MPSDNTPNIQGLNKDIDWKERALTAERERSYWRHLAQKRQRDKNALVAQVERLARLLERAQTGLDWYRDMYPEADSGTDDEHASEVEAALAAKPENSLAKLKAQWQAEAYTKTLDEMRLALRDCRTVQALDVAISAVHELRQQAEGRQQ